MRRGCFPDECLLVSVGDSPPLILHLPVLGNEQNSCHSSTKPSKQPHGNGCKRFSFRSYKDFFGRFPVEEVLRSEEHTSELQSQSNIVCRLLLEKKTRQQS